MELNHLDINCNIQNSMNMVLTACDQYERRIDLPIESTYEYVL